MNIELLNESMELAQEERDELPFQKVKCPIEGDEFDSYEEFEAHWDREHEMKYGSYGEFKQPLTKMNKCPYCFTEIPEGLLVSHLQGTHKDILEKHSKEKFKKIGEKLEGISKNYLKSTEYKEALLKECLSIVNKMEGIPVEEIDFETLKKQAEYNLMKRAVKGIRTEKPLTQKHQMPLGEELKNASMKYRKLLSGNVRMLWELYEGDKTELMGMKDWIEGKHTGTPMCPICRETTFTKAKNEKATDTNLGRNKVVLKPITCLEHMRLAHPIDYERMQKLEEIKDMTFDEYIKSYSTPEKLSKKGTLFSKGTQVLAKVLEKDIVVEELSKDSTKVGRQRAFLPSEEDENKHHDECLAKALETEVIEELSKKAKKDSKVPKPKTKIPNSVER